MKLVELIGAEDRFIDSARPDALPNQLDRVSHRYCDDDLYGIGKERAVDRYILFKFFRPHESILFEVTHRPRLKGNLNTNAFHPRFRYLNPHCLLGYQAVGKAIRLDGSL